MAQLEKARQDVVEHKEFMGSIDNTLAEALQMNGLEASETVEESIRLLGTTCKEYGQKKSVHTLAQQNGNEVNVSNELKEGYFDPKDEHNNID